MVKYIHKKVFRWWNIYIKECINDRVYDRRYRLWNIHIIKFIKCTQDGLYI